MLRLLLVKENMSVVVVVVLVVLLVVVVGRHAMVTWAPPGCWSESTPTPTLLCWSESRIRGERSNGRKIHAAKVELSMYILCTRVSRGCPPLFPGIDAHHLFVGFLFHCCAATAFAPWPELSSYFQFSLLHLLPPPYHMLCFFRDVPIEGNGKGSSSENLIKQLTRWTAGLVIQCQCYLFLK